MHSIVSVFQEAGLPRGVLNFLAHDPRDAALITEQLISNPLISKVNFTGSTTVGRVIGRLAGHHLKPVLLELGGKAPVIICEDADLEAAAQECVVGAFLNSGQICMSTERILVHSRIRVQFEQRLIDATERMFGALDKALLLINSAAVARCKNLLEDAVSKGASLVYGDVADAFSSPAHMRPVVISGVTKDMDIYRTESFGPSVSLFVFESEEEALELANHTDYGLSSAIFTRDLARGLKLAKGIESGAVHINSMTVHDESALPHGGVKASGFGRFNASGLEEWTQTKTITFRL
jgi:acyl-CoA reductase-like NAD-dependent aldehyde dehydrogenase